MFKEQLLKVNYKVRQEGVGLQKRVGNSPCCGGTALILDRRGRSHASQMCNRNNYFWLPRSQTDVMHCFFKAHHVPYTCWFNVTIIVIKFMEYVKRIVCNGVPIRRPTYLAKVVINTSGISICSDGAKLEFDRRDSHMITIGTYSSMALLGASV